MTFHVCGQDFAHDEGLVATSRQRFADQPFGAAVRIHFRCVDQGHSQIDSDPQRRYHAGALLLDLHNPAQVVYQSPVPVLSPETADETTGVVSNVVFPTGAVEHADGQIDVYYGMADQAIGLATTTLSTGR